MAPRPSNTYRANGAKPLLLPVVAAWDWVLKPVFKIVRDPSGMAIHDPKTGLPLRMKVGVRPRSKTYPHVSTRARERARARLTTLEQAA